MSVGCFQRRLFVCVCLFVCQHDNFLTSKHRMIKLRGRYIVQKSRPSSNVGVIAPWVRTSQNVALGYNVAKISVGCLVCAMHPLKLVWAQTAVSFRCSVNYAKRSFLLCSKCNFCQGWSFGLWGGDASISCAEMCTSAVVWLTRTHHRDEKPERDLTYHLTCLLIYHGTTTHLLFVTIFK